MTVPGFEGRKWDCEGHDSSALFGCPLELLLPSAPVGAILPCIVSGLLLPANSQAKVRVTDLGQAAATT